MSIGDNMSIEQQLEKIMLVVTGLAKDIEELKANKQDKESEYLSKQEIDSLLDKAEKSELDIMKEKYESGDYICLYINIDKKWCKVAFDRPSWTKNNIYKLIHKRHSDILDAYLEDSSIEIKNLTNSAILDTGIWLNTYNEYKEYVLIKPKEEYPQFRIDSDGYILKWEEESIYEVMLSSCVEDIGKKFCRSIWNDLEPIPYNKERGLYHKQPCWYGNTYGYSKIRRIGFYNSNDENKDLIEPITPEQLKVMPFIFEIYKQLED